MDKDAVDSLRERHLFRTPVSLTSWVSGLYLVSRLPRIPLRCLSRCALVPVRTVLGLPREEEPQEALQWEVLRDDLVLRYPMGRQPAQPRLVFVSGPDSL